MRNIFIYVVTALLLGGCGEKIASLCGQSGGECCAVQYGADQTGKYTSKVLSCRRSADACLEAAGKYGGVPRFPYSPDIGTERGQCEMKIATVPIWEANGLITLARSISAIATTKPTEIKGLGGELVRKTDNNYCQQACLSGDAGLCPTVVLRNDISLGLLTTFVDLAENVAATPKVTKMSEVMANFGMSGIGNACGRGDVVSSTTAIVNSAPLECPVEMMTSTALGNFEAKLSLPVEISGVPVPSEKLVAWSDEKTAISLAVANSALQPIYSGPIEAAARVDHTSIAAQVRGKADVGCAQIVPEVEAEFDVRAKSQAMEAQPDSVRQALTKLSEYRQRLLSDLSSDRKKELEQLVISSTLQPFNQYVAAMDKIAGANKLPPSDLANVKISTPHGAITATDVIKLIDIQTCSDANATTAASKLIALQPMVTDAKDFSSPGLQRNTVAGQIIQCKFSAEKISPKAKDILRKR